VVLGGYENLEGFTIMGDYTVPPVLLLVYRVF
jgi:hypothetical protein